MVMSPYDEQMKALRELDMVWARRQIPKNVHNPDPVAMLAGMHMARYVCKDLEPHYRHISYKWLKKRNMKCLGLPLLPEGKLP